MGKLISCGLLTVISILSSATMGQSIVRGRVLDQNDASVPGFIVRASSMHRVYETRTDADGKYFLRLLPGVYVVSAHWEKDGYWYPLRRSNLLVKSDSIYEVDLWPCQRMLSTSLAITNRGITEPTLVSRIPRYREYKFGDDGKIKLLLQFSKLGESWNKVHDVILTYDRYTIHADFAESVSRSRMIVLQGNVRFSGVSKTVSSNQAILFLKQSGPVLVIEGTSHPLTWKIRK